MEPIKKDDLKHIGIIRRSGRYPWGSGQNPYQRSAMFRGFVNDMRSKGLTDSQIAQFVSNNFAGPEEKFSTGDLRDMIGHTTEVIRAENQSMARHLVEEKQMSVRAVADRMLGDPKKESTIRGWLKTSEDIKDKTLTSIAELLRGHLGTKKWLDVGQGTEHHLGISKVKLRGAVSILRDEGHSLHPVKVPQLGRPGELTNVLVLGPKDATWHEARDAVLRGEVFNIKDRSENGGLSFLTPKAEPVSVNSKRIAVRYGNDGGAEMDGVIELRRGVPDLDLGDNHYAQVRVAVDGTHYLKGMAMYADDLPAGVDIRFNTNKASGTPLKGDRGVLKPLKLNDEDAGNRFGAQIKPYPRVYTDAKGVERTSALNIVNEEGDWDRWTRSLSSQMLSKQSVNLAATQLSKTRAIEQDNLNKIMALTNPVVKKHLLFDYAQKVDSAAIHLKAASLPRQSSHVILPMNSMRPNEIYAPNFDDGDKVVLVRYPHGGPFEIPQLTVNNNNATAKRLIGPSKDAVGIHHSVANQLSGADFDGDSVLVIPNNNARIKTRPPLAELEGFDPKSAYPESPGMKYMKYTTPAGNVVDNTQKEMGKISNLITDMTIKAADTSEIARAVKHSMVVIDAEKHNLDYKLSEKDNGISQLKARYQRDPANPSSRGASTIISRSGAKVSVPKATLRKASEGGRIDPETGQLVYVPVTRTRTVTRTNPRTGEVTTTTEPVTEKIARGDSRITTDARTLSSGEPMEEVYAQHANELKALANTARKEYTAIKDPAQSPAAKAIYSNEVASLKTKLQNAQMNAPLERRAQILGNAAANARIASHPEWDDDDKTKARYSALQDARLQTGAAKQRIGSKDVPITPREWEAVQSGAVSATMLRDILNNSDIEAIQKLATPKRTTYLTTGQLALAKSLIASGRPLAQIAAELGIPRSTLSDNLQKS